MSNNLNGVRWAVLGDSMSEGIATVKYYHEWIAESKGCTVINLAHYGTGYKRPYNNGNSPNFLDVVRGLDPSSFDVLTIFGGVNDHSFTMGTVNDRTEDTALGCVNLAIEAYRSIAGNKPIGIATSAPVIDYPTSDTGNWEDLYSNAVKQICAREGIPCLDVYHDSNMQPWDTEFRQQYYADGWHPNSEGHRVFLAPMFENLLSQLAQDEQEEKDMSECLVTVLKDTVDDDSLLKLGEFKIHVDIPASFTQPVLALGMTQWPNPGDVNMKIVGNGYFTDSTGTQNYGKTYTKGAGGNTFFYLSKGEYDLLLDNKYEIRRIVLSQQNDTEVNLSDLEFTPINDIDLRYINVHGDISNVTKQSDLYKFSVISKKKADITGNLSVFADKTSLDTLMVQDTDIKGNIASLAGCSSLTYITIARTAINGDISALSGLSALSELWAHNSAISGNVSALSNLTNLINASFSNDIGISGNLSSFANLTNLVRLDVNGTSVVGDTSSLAGLTKLTTFNYTNTAITGTWPLT